MSSPLLIVVITALLTLLTTGLLFVVGYLLVLTCAAYLAHPSHPLGPGTERSFAILIPAHEEEALIGRLLQSLRQLDYPESGFQVYVVADNCDDRTAAIARSAGARVFERYDDLARGKGFALGWLLQRIVDESPGYDGYVVLDADSVVAPNFLRAMNSRLAAGSKVIQAYYSVLNSGASSVAALRYGALAAVHYLRPLGRSVLGLSCGLKGNGMCFSAGIIEKFGWHWFTLAEDVEFHLALVRHGVRVDFAPETSVLADMPINLIQAETQNARWERGRLQMLSRQVPSLLWLGLKQRSVLTLDAAIEQLIPPLSVPFMLCGLALILSLALRANVPAMLSAASLVGQVVYLLTALLLVRAPLSAYLVLGYAPVYIVWKTALYGRALISHRGGRWIRTPRVPETDRYSVPVN
jgi:1,2-diacylglycerol 3-beta-glucosyltransferase